MDKIVKMGGKEIKIEISENHLKYLEEYSPKGCYKNDYSLWDLLFELIGSYNWIIKQREISLIDFIRELQKEDNAKAICYGNSIIDILEVA